MTSATPRIRPVAGALTLLALLAGPAPSQEHLGTYSGDQLEAGFGPSAPAGDLDFDGVPDQVIGAPDAGGQSGLVSVVSGATGAELWRWSSTLSGERLGHSVDGSPDVDGDGVPDVIVGAPGAAGGAGRVLVLSGRDGSLALELTGSQAGAGFGSAVSTQGDVDGDGRADLLIGAPFHHGPAGADAGAVFSVSGRDGAILAESHGASAGDLFGWSLDGSISSGDGSPDPIIGLTVSGDGSPDPVIGAPQSGNDGAGYAAQLSASDLSLVFLHAGSAPGDRFGASVALAGDLDGDGVVDLIVGAATDDAAGEGYARAFSGAGGHALLAVTSGLAGDGFGAAVAGVGDVDGDGRDDVAVGAPHAQVGGGVDAGTARIYSGADGSLMHLVHGEPGSRLGAQLALAGDVDGDGLADCALSAPGGGVGATGHVFVFSMARWIDLHGGVTGTSGVPRLEANGETEGGATVVLRLEDAEPYAHALLIAGTALVFDPTVDAFTPTGDVWVDDVVISATGDLTCELTLPLGLPSQSVLYYQFIVDDPGGPDGTARSNTMAGRTP